MEYLELSPSWDQHQLSNALYNQQIKEMDAKIRNVNDEIDTAQREIANDQAIIDELLPKKKRLEEAQSEKEIKHKRRIEELQWSGGKIRKNQDDNYSWFQKHG